MLRYLLYLTGNRELAEDLFQEVWMRVLLRGAQYNGQARFETWLFTIARNLVIDQKRKRTVASLDELVEGSGDDDRPMSLEIADGDLTPFDHFSRLEHRERVAAALLELDTLHREVLVLRFHEELSLEEIAKVTQGPSFHRKIQALSRLGHDQTHTRTRTSPFAGGGVKTVGFPERAIRRIEGRSNHHGPRSAFVAGRYPGWP